MDNLLECDTDFQNQTTSVWSVCNRQPPTIITQMIQFSSSILLHIIVCLFKDWFHRLTAVSPNSSHEWAIGRECTCTLSVIMETSNRSYVILLLMVAMVFNRIAFHFRTFFLFCDMFSVSVFFPPLHLRQCRFFLIHYNIVLSGYECDGKWKYSSYTFSFEPIFQTFFERFADIYI